MALSSDESRALAFITLVVALAAAARVAGALSITIWTCVIFLGRWIGFTGGYEVPVPEDLDFDFSGF